MNYLCEAEDILVLNFYLTDVRIFTKNTFIYKGG